MEEEKHLKVDVLDEIKKTKTGEVDWLDYEHQILESLDNNDPDKAEMLLAEKHPLILHEEHILQRLDLALQEKYGRNSYLRLDPELDNKHITQRESIEEE